VNHSRAIVTAAAAERSCLLLLTGRHTLHNAHTECAAAIAVKTDECDESAPHLPDDVLSCQLRLQLVESIPEGRQGVQELHGCVHIAGVAQVAQPSWSAWRLQG
jgi:hypothetical protein